jgi:hypothetical protein
MMAKKVRQGWERGFRCRPRYLATVDSATAIPNFSSSPWMRGAPHSGFTWLMRRIRSRISAATSGLPG